VTYSAGRTRRDSREGGKGREREREERERERNCEELMEQNRGEWKIVGRSGVRKGGKPYDVLVVSLNAASYNATT